MSLRWKIAIAVGAMAALAALAIGLLSYRAARDRMYAEIDVSLTDAVAIVRGDDRLPDWDGPRPGPRSSTRPSCSDPTARCGSRRRRRGSPTPPPCRSSGGRADPSSTP